MLALWGSLIWLINNLFPETNLPNGPHIGRLSFAFGVAVVSLAVCYGLCDCSSGPQGLCPGNVHRAESDGGVHGIT
jgi:hypothetical protein